MTRGTAMTLLEELAELEHEQWIVWSKNITETENITSGRQKRWEKLWHPYAELTEAEKNQDREWAGKAMEIIKKHEINGEIEAVHCRTLDMFIPFYGKDRGDVIKNLALRWIEQNIENSEAIITINRKYKEETEGE